MLLKEFVKHVVSEVIGGIEAARKDGRDSMPYGTGAIHFQVALNARGEVAGVLDYSPGIAKFTVEIDR